MPLKSDSAAGLCLMGDTVAEIPKRCVVEVAASRVLSGTEELYSIFSLFLDMPPLEHNAVPILHCRYPQSYGLESQSDCRDACWQEGRGALDALRSMTAVKVLTHVIYQWQ